MEHGPHSAIGKKAVSLYIAREEGKYAEVDGILRSEYNRKKSYYGRRTTIDLHADKSKALETLMADRTIVCRRRRRPGTFHGERATESMTEGATERATRWVAEWLEEPRELGHF